MCRSPPSLRKADRTLAASRRTNAHAPACTARPTLRPSEQVLCSGQTMEPRYRQDAPQMMIVRPGRELTHESSSFSPLLAATDPVCSANRHWRGSMGAGIYAPRAVLSRRRRSRSQSLICLLYGNRAFQLQLLWLAPALLVSNEDYNPRACPACSDSATVGCGFVETQYIASLRNHNHALHAKTARALCRRCFDCPILGGDATRPAARLRFLLPRARRTSARGRRPASEPAAAYLHRSSPLRRHCNRALDLR